MQMERWTNFQRLGSAAGKNFNFIESSKHELLNKRSPKQQFELAEWVQNTQTPATANNSNFIICWIALAGRLNRYTVNVRQYWSGYRTPFAAPRKTEKTELNVMIMLLVILGTITAGHLRNRQRLHMFHTGTHAITLLRGQNVEHNLWITPLSAPAVL